MKKTYTVPCMKVYALENMQMICSSFHSVSTTDLDGFEDFGGSAGNMEADVKGEGRNLWGGGW